MGVANFGMGSATKGFSLGCPCNSFWDVRVGFLRFPSLVFGVQDLGPSFLQTPVCFPAAADKKVDGGPGAGSRDTAGTSSSLAVLGLGCHLRP